MICIEINKFIFGQLIIFVIYVVFHKKST